MVLPVGLHMWHVLQGQLSCLLPHLQTTFFFTLILQFLQFQSSFILQDISEIDNKVQAIDLVLIFKVEFMGFTYQFVQIKSECGQIKKTKFRNHIQRAKMTKITKRVQNHKKNYTDSKQSKKMFYFNFSILKSEWKIFRHQFRIKLFIHLNFIIVFHFNTVMVITNLQEKQNRKIWVPIRGGNRGGWSLFNWEDVRQMPYKDREMYLGNSFTIGVLDKGGKWRKRDWYTKTDKHYKSDDLAAQHTQAVKRDYERMNAALGIDQKQDEQKLTEQEMRQLMKKIKMKKQGYEEPAAPDAIGLGFDKAKVQIRSKPSVKSQNPHRLQAIDQFKYQQNQQKEQRGKTQKRQKKQKKQKRKKDREHKHKNREDDQQGQQKKKKKKDKHHKRQKRQKEQKGQRKRDRSRSNDKQRRKRHSSSQSRGSDSK